MSEYHFIALYTGEEISRAWNYLLGREDADADILQESPGGVKLKDVEFLIFPSTEEFTPVVNYIRTGDKGKDQ